MTFYGILTALILSAPVAAFAADATPPATAPASGADAAAAATTVHIGPRWVACTAEIQKLCANIEHGKGKMRACLEGHAADLSEPCKATVAEHAAQHPN